MATFCRFTLCCLLVPAPALAGEVEVTFVDHITAEMIEQDVYVERDGGMVFRVTPADYSDHMDAKVYTTAAGVEHDPMGMDKIGPYEKGMELGFTLDEWLNATGTAKITCENGAGSISAEFENLVPDGLYTMWQFWMGMPLPAHFSTYDMPVGARDGSESVFTADANGNAVYEASFEPCLQGGGSQLGSGLAIAYHSDGMTYGYEPGSMGDKTHIHLFSMLPTDTEMPH